MLSEFDLPARQHAAKDLHAPEADMNICIYSGIPVMRRKDGVTLIELLVVIGIIAVLAAIVLPVITRAQEKSRQVTCVGNLKQLGGAMAMYAEDWDGLFPAARVSEGGDGNPQGNWAGAYHTFGVDDPALGALYSYVKSRGVYLCPSDKGASPPYILDPAALPYPLSYSMNWNLSFRNPDTAAVPTSEIGLLIHEARDSIDDGAFCTDWVNVRNKPSRKHNDGTCVLYCDLHVSWRDYDAVGEELMQGRWNLQ